MASPRLATPPRGRVTRVAAPPPVEEEPFSAGFKDTILQTHFEVPQRLGDYTAVADGLWSKCTSLEHRAADTKVEHTEVYPAQRHAKQDGLLQH